MNRVVLEAEEGMIYTDFKTWGKKIYLSDEADKDCFIEVPLENVDEILMSNEKWNN